MSLKSILVPPKIKVAMKNIFILLISFLTVVCRAQSLDNPSTITVKGDFSGVITNPLGNGETETIIACICSERDCYTITKGIHNNDHKGHIDANCGLKEINVIPIGTKISLMFGEELQSIEGSYLKYSNFYNTSNVLKRYSRFILKQ